MKNIEDQLFHFNQHISENIFVTKSKSNLLPGLAYL
jgi:hypothetical protein